MSTKMFEVPPGPRWLVLWFATWLAVVAGLEGVTAADTEAPPELVATLNAAFDQWLEDVTFTSTYRLVRGRSDTLEAGLKGDWKWYDTLTSGDRIVRYGVFVKQKDSVRLSQTPNIPATEVEGKQGVWTNIAYDEASSNEMFLTKYLPFAGPHGRITVGDNSDDQKGLLGKFVAGKQSKYELTPLSIMGGPPIHPLVLAGIDSSGEVRASMEELEDGVAVTLIFNGSGNKKSRRVEFWTDTSPPVVRRIDQRSERGSSVVVSVAAASNFVKCPGGMVAKDIFYVVSNKSKSVPDLPWSATHWSSDDLGKRPPIPSDFAIEVAKGTLVSGLRKDRDESPTLNIKTLGIAELTSHSKNIPVASGNGRMAWLYAAGIIILVAAVAIGVLRKFGESR